MAWLLIAMHGAALLALYSLDGLMWLNVTALFLLGFSLRYYLRHYAWLQAPASCVGLELDTDGLKLLQRNGVRLQCEISHDSLVTPYLNVVKVTMLDLQRARYVVILPDSMEPDAFRQFRVWLKWGRQPAI